MQVNEEVQILGLDKFQGVFDLSHDLDLKLASHLADTAPEPVGVDAQPIAAEVAHDDTFHIDHGYHDHGVVFQQLLHLRRGLQELAQKALHHKGRQRLPRVLPRDYDHHLYL